MRSDIFLGLFASLAGLASAGNFMATCENPLYNLRDLFHISCLDQFGILNDSTMDLDRCLAFTDNRELVAQANGNFSAMCASCTLKSEPRVSARLECICRASNGVRHYPAIELNNVLANQNGRLECFGHVAQPGPWFWERKVKALRV